MYRIALAAGFPFILTFILVRGLRDRRYFRHGWERWGFLPRSLQRTAQRSIWLHAVSVGEVLSSTGLVQALRQKHPDAAIFVSCMTVTGRAVAQEKLSDFVEGIFYLPWDYPGAIRRVLRQIRPAVVVVLETEIWPNLYREVKRSGAGLLVVNGRISMKAIPKYRRWKILFHEVLAWPDAILAQSPRNQAFYRELGAPPDRVCVSGNLKYDFTPQAEPPAAIREWLAATGEGPVWVAASTTGPMADGEPDEDQLVFNTFQHLLAKFPGLRLILAPRKPERFDTIRHFLANSGAQFVSRSTLPARNGAAPILLLDSLGELNSLFSYATAVFVGGSLVSRGGHNILEPALCGVAVLVGPHMENFQEILDRFRAGNAILQIEPSSLASSMERLFSDSAFRNTLGTAGKAVAEAERGAVGRAVAAVSESLSQVVPNIPRPGQRWLRALTPLWRWGAERKRRANLAASCTLAAPVISVGNLTSTLR